MPDHALWMDVRVSVAHTEALVHELLATAATVEASLAVLAAGSIGPDDWGGPHRRAFDDEREVLLRRGTELVDALVASARQAAMLLAAGEGEQRFRDRLRHGIEVASRPEGAS
jgi:hypothetical protein